MNDTNTNKADDMNEDDVTLTGSEGENTAADATADTATESPDAAGASDSTTVPDSVQFSIVFDDDGDDSDAIVIDAADAEIDTTAEADTTVAMDGSAEEAPVDDEKPGDDTQDAAAQEPASADNTADNTSADTGDADTGATAAGTADENLDVAAANASKVNETLKLSTGGKTAGDGQKKTRAGRVTVASASVDPAMRLSSRIDKELKRSKADSIRLKSYPTFSMNKVTVTDKKSGRHVLDRMTQAFYAGHVYSVLLPDNDRVLHETLMGVMSGIIRPHDGNVMNKSANLLELEPGEVRGHRLGLVPQQYAVRDDMSAERNLVYAMDASGRTFLKPKPVIARELLHKVHFDVDTPNAPVGKLDVVEQRRVAIARAIACEAEVLIADEPTGGLNDDDSVEILQLLTSLTHGDPKRCVIILTESEAVANIAETIIKL
ncbi:MAG: ATP-binding cassette domain-containing protein [Bifidobacterium bifidum]|nr:ATP-binding cassette domain-containing protein [Bifidobacterium bifidum]